MEILKNLAAKINLMDLFSYTNGDDRYDLHSKCHFKKIHVFFIFLMTEFWFESWICIIIIIY